MKPVLSPDAWPLLNLERLMIVWVAAGLLLVGSATVDERLVFNGIPINPILFGLAALFALSLPLSSSQLKSLLLIQLPLLPLGLTLLWSPDTDYGAYKLFNLFLVLNVVAPVLLYSIATYGTRQLGHGLLLFFSVLLFLAFVYKLAFGLFDRNVNFLLNGPIVFARLMSIALLLSLFVTRGLLRIVLAGVFTLAIFWTASKGPIIAVAAVLGWLYLVRLGLGQKLLLALAMAAVLGAIVVWLGGSQLEVFQTYFSRLDVLNALNLDSFLRQGNYDSFSGRFWTAKHTLDLIAENPMGVGLGGWETSVSNNLGLRYPHNIFLELWSEGGLILGSIALLSFFCVFFTNASVWKYIAICMFANQLVSGDLLDSRYVLLFSLLALHVTLRPDPVQSALPAGQQKASSPTPLH